MEKFKYLCTASTEDGKYKTEIVTVIVAKDAIQMIKEQHTNSKISLEKKITKLLRDTHTWH